MTQPLVVAGELRDAMVAHARFTFPEEACGLLAGPVRGHLRMAYCLTNRDRSAYRYTIDPTEHFRAMQHADRNGWALRGAFHSHPTSPAFPSGSDIAGALETRWMYLIVGLAEPEEPEVRAFEISEGTARERPIVSEREAASSNS